jgi:hypothetical protein
VTRRPDTDPDEPESPGGHAAERLRQFLQARGSSGPPEVPAEHRKGTGDNDTEDNGPHLANGRSGSSATGQPCDGDEGQNDEGAVPPPE